MRLGLAASLLLLLPVLAHAQVGAPPVTGQAVTVPGLPEGRLTGSGPVASAGDVDGDGYDDVIVGKRVYFGGPTADTTADLILTINATGAGDVNGDGYDDLISGDPYNDAGGTNAGRAYVFFGGPTADAIADLTLTGEAAYDRFGYSVASAGDVNGDGYADVIVGADESSAGEPQAGRAYVFFGGSTPNATADLTFTGEFSNDYFGDTVDGAGDVNGDGYDDVIVGAYSAYADGVGYEAGRAYIFFGGPTADATADITLSGGSENDYFGSSVAGAGDINGDGYADVLVGSTGVLGAGAGRVRVIFGGPNSPIGLTFSGADADEQLGEWVAGAGDVNGDSYADFIVGKRVYFGGPAADTTADLTLEGWATSAGDFDGDGLADLIFGISGGALLVSNANTGAGLAEWRALGQAGSDWFGASVSGAGDVNGDGYDDVIVGAQFNVSGGSETGRAYVYYGGPITDDTADLALTGEADLDQFGVSVAGAGDVNGDGFDDLIVGASQNDAGGSGAGRAYVFYGGPIADDTADLTLTGKTAGDNFGFSVASAGDINGDGYDDVAVGISQNVSGGSDPGRAYVYFGGPTADNTADVTLTGEASNDYFGETVASAGDVNGDGYGDLFVGAHLHDTGGSNTGRAYVYFGGPTVDNTADVTLNGETAGDLFGESIASAGDINGDGYGDLIVGARGNDEGGSGSGRAYVYFGGPNADDTADLTLTGEAASDRFGVSVGGAGDVNGDGYGDLIVGARGNDEGGSGSGRAYVYFGGPNADDTADLTLTGEAAGDSFGFSTASAGDTNGDGRTDVIVGAYQNDASGSDAGAAYLYRATGPASSPSLYRLADVPGDQGGSVQIRWTRSDQETQGNASSYHVERSQPAGSGGYAWEAIATVAASGRSRYSLTADTYSDQTGSNSGVTCFQVTAEGDAGEIWRSVVQCGASIDNLAPPAPSGLAADASSSGDVLVSIEALASPPVDLAGYTVYRSTDNTCEGTDTEIGLVADNGNATVSFEDGDTPFGTDVFYCATATDVHGNQSPFVGAASANPAVLASVKLVLQGAYQSGLPDGALMRADIEDVLPLIQPYAASPWGYTGTEAIDPTDTSPANGRPDVLDTYDVVDWVLVEIRASPTVSSEHRAAALLLADGTLLDPVTSAPYASIKPATPGSYHVAVTHRSHLAAMTAFAIGLTGAAPSSAFNLSADPSNTYGSGGIVELASGVYGLFAADGSGDGLVTAPDFNLYSSASASGATGYRVEDYTMDGLVTAPDFNLYNANAAAGAATAVPEN